MTNTLVTLSLALVATQAFALSNQASTIYGNENGEKVVYGSDNRLEPYEASAAFQTLSLSTAAMIPWSDMEPSTVNGSKVYTLGTTTLKEAQGLCDGEKFENQITAAYCSGFMVGPDLLVTAGHCIKSKSDCDARAWVFDYKMDPTGAAPSTFSQDKVFRCVEVISQELNNATKMDYALIRLDRAVGATRLPLTVRTEGDVTKSDLVTVMGHPSGLPLKITTSAKVRDVTNPAYFVTNLDTFGGNSGSAVFNERTGAVEGILVRGEEDYSYDVKRGCYRVNVCSEDGCRGEDVTKITNVKEIRYRDAFMKAAKEGDLLSMNSVLAITTKILNITDSAGNTALMNAAMFNQVGAIKRLMGLGADLKRRNVKGQDVIDLAYSTNNVAAFSEVVSNAGVAASAQLTAKFVDAVLKGNVGMVRVLLASGSVSASALDPQGRSAMSVAYAQSNIELLTLLMSYSSDARVMNALFIQSVSEGKMDMVTLFLTSKRIDINASDVNGRTALHKAVAKKDMSLVKLLVEAGANVKIEDKSGMTPIELARKLHERDIKRYLKKHRS